ncbi:MAG TPA: hypothetical protein VIR81_09040 [Myxococcales bacterium]|nr:hypothetical protein [Myxococcales bacterium]
MRSWVALVTALALGWSSVVDNPGVCPDDWPGTASSHPCNDDGAPATRCASCPCHLPSLRFPSDPALEPPLRIAAQPGNWPEQQVHAEDLAAPPTPPPLA